MKLDFFFQGISDKYACLQELMGKYNLNAWEVAYIGDDIIDLKVILACGLGVSPSDGVEYVKAEADLITTATGGNGVVREVGDLILASKGLLDNVIESYKI